MRYVALPLADHPLYPPLNADRYAPETAQVQRLLTELGLSGARRRSILERAQGWVTTLRAGSAGLGRPVIDAEAQRRRNEHARRMEREGRLLYRCKLPQGCRHGTFVAPQAFEIDTLKPLTGEVFGPILHVIRFDAGDLDRVIAAINDTGYGLTFGVHSRIDRTVTRLTASIRTGNRYVNRNLIGAVVGVQPFGGEGLSGTGPLAAVHDRTGPDHQHRRHGWQPGPPFAVGLSRPVGGPGARGLALNAPLERSP